MRDRSRPGVSIVMTCLLALVAVPSSRAAWQFVEVAASAGAEVLHGFVSPAGSEAERFAGGVAAGDIDGDGWIDLVVVTGDISPNAVLRNRGDGSFEPWPNPGQTSPVRSCGALIADVDGDGWNDVLLGALKDATATPQPFAWRNTGQGTLIDATIASGLADGLPIYSLAMADTDLDGDLDLATTHWIHPKGVTIRRNDGAMHLTDLGTLSGVTGQNMFAYTPNFSDIDEDGWVDLLISADFGTSAWFTNDQDGSFTRVIDPAISDDNGMGGTCADFDGDGHLDWFVTSVWDPNGTSEGYWGVSGNRLYSNQGVGSFTDVTDDAGVREGFWGWGACAADFNNDGLIDLFHTNGYNAPNSGEFLTDASRLYIAQSDGTFLDQAAALGLIETAQGRGVACADYDRDGDVDIFVSNNDGPSHLWRNDLDTPDHWLGVRLTGDPPNTAGVGARISLTAAGTTQVREVRAGSNYASSDPPEVQFGLGALTVVDELRVDWPGGGTSVLTGLAVDRLLTVSASPAPPPGVPDGRPGSGAPMLVDRLDLAGDDLSISWDAAACGGATDHRLLYGSLDDLPGAPGAPFAVSGALCNLGTGPTADWIGSPDAAALPGGLLWWLLVADDGDLTEGSWGIDGTGHERRGPGPSGSSSQCGVVRVDTAAGCAP